MKNTVIKAIVYLLIHIVCYSFFPVLVKIFPDSLAYYEGMLDLWILGPIISFAVSMIICSFDNFTYYLPIVCGLAYLFVMLVFYSIDNFPFLVAYIVISLAGCFVGQFIYSRRQAEIY